MIGWLRRQAGDLVAITDYLGERDAAVTARDQAVRRMLTANADRIRDIAAARRTAAAAKESADRLVEGCQAIVLTLLEPGHTETCHKVRLRDQDDAQAFADRVTADTGVLVEPYKCRRCPRQPVSLEAFWHVTHTDLTKRGQKGRADPPRPQQLLKHVTPADIARMHARAADEPPPTTPGGA